MEIELETIHLTALALTAIVILYSDHMGFAYFRGKRLTLPLAFVTWSHRLVWAGLITMILSGFFMVLPAWEYYLEDPVFFVKMGFVLTLVVNAFFIGKLSLLTTERAFAELPLDIKKTLLVSGALSGIGWIGAAIIGFFFL
jgi:uncharacterized membrane protein